MGRLGRLADAVFAERLPGGVVLGRPAAGLDRRRSIWWRRRSRRAGRGPARRCVTVTGWVTVGPPRVAAMLAAPTRSRCPVSPQ